VHQANSQDRRTRAVLPGYVRTKAQSGMLCTRKIAFLFFVVLAVAAAVPVAEARTNTSFPGSVLVFPLFETGSVTTGDLGPLPVSSFEISVKCPDGATCPGGTDVDIHVEWVCPGFLFSPCNETNFTLNATVNGTIRFNPTSSVCEPAPSSQDPEGCGNVQMPSCNEGFVIAWVVDETGAPIKFDSLIGDAVLREVPGAVTAYDAIPIQAGTALATGASTDLKHDGQLHFDDNAYIQVTGKIISSVQYDVVNAAGADQDATSLILLTLDTLSNSFNNPVDVNLTFYDEIEQVTSTSTEFFCFGETGSLNAAFGLNSGTFGPKGLVVSTSAVKTPILGINDKGGRVTLLGLIITREFDPTAATELRHFVYPFYYDNPATTAFVP
jgi:hypothetical protein